MRKFLSVLILFICISGYKAFPEEVIGSKKTVSGSIKDATNGEVLIGATVVIKELKTGTTTNAYGFYSLSMVPGKYTLEYSYVGYTSYSQIVNLNDNNTLNVELSPESKELNEIVVTSEKSEVKKPEMSMQKLQIETIKKIPAMMGEVDVIKAIQLLPGVQAASEGTSSFSVRGGGIDQNLIVLDEATVYNASHLMGFFSVFNNDAIRDVKLYKGDIPPSYGGRLSSVMEVDMKDGNSKKLAVTGGVGIISSRITVESPIIKDKMSFLVSGRRTYADLFFPLSSNKDLQKSTLYFYDLNGKLNWQINENNKLFLSGYMGNDNFGQASFANIGFGNKTATIRWNHLFTKKLFSNVSAIYSNYDYRLNSKFGSDEYNWQSNLKDKTLKMDFHYYITPDFTLKFGGSSTFHTFDPCNAWITHKNDSVDRLHLQWSYAFESGAYIAAQNQIGEKITLKYGVRYSVFQNIGATSYYNYNTAYQVTDTVKVGANKIYNTNAGFEPRVGINYNINSVSTVKASYSRTLQFVQLASNSTGGMPLDIWFPSSSTIKPQKADQYAIGYFRSFFDNKIEASVETYYKQMYDVIDFRDHAQLLMNPKLEGEVRTGTAKAYGVEFLVKKSSGKINGWISYTLSKSKRTIAQINDGQEYLSPYDRPHYINIVANYELTKRLMVSATWVYSTGAPATFPNGAFEYQNSMNKIYGPRNSDRYPDYHRLDLSVSRKNRDLFHGKVHNELVFSLYNAYGRHNTWIINFVQDEQNPRINSAQNWYLFTFFPSVTWNFNF